MYLFTGKDTLVLSFVQSLEDIKGDKNWSRKMRHVVIFFKRLFPILLQIRCIRLNKRELTTVLKNGAYSCPEER